MIVSKKALGTFMLVVSFTGIILFSRNWASLVFASSTPVVTYTTHVVLFQFKESAGSMAVKEITSSFVALKKACIHPDTGRPYIVSVSGGKDMSVEDLQKGISHAFILQFYSNEHRDYYVHDDPVHQAFKEAASAVVEKTLVVDFQDGVFTKR